jgi:hypothetical protein
MPTNEEAGRTYELALAALRNTIADPDITGEQRRIAQQKRDRLILDFIDRAIADIDARTAKFRAFIREMEEVIAEFDPSTTIAGILTLKAVVDGAAGLVSAATETPAPAGAGMSPHIAAAKPTPEPASVARPSKAPRRPAATAKRRSKAKGKGKAATPVARKRAAKKPAVRKRVAKKAAAAKKPRAKRPRARRR